MTIEAFKLIVTAALAVGMAGVSAYLHVRTKGEYGEGWGFLAFIAFAVFMIMLFLF